MDQPKPNQNQSILDKEMQAVKNECYQIYKQFNPGKELPKDKIDERVDEMIKKFVIFTKLNSKELNN